MEDERVWQVPITERELALAEKLAEGRQVLAWGHDLAAFLPALSRRSRALLATALTNVVRGLPDRSFSLFVLDDFGTRGLPLTRRLASPAALYLLVGAEHVPSGLAVFQRVGSLRVCRDVAAPTFAPAPL